MSVDTYVLVMLDWEKLCTIQYSIQYCLFLAFSASEKKCRKYASTPGAIFEGAPDHVVAAGRARARVRGSGLKPKFQGVPSKTFVFFLISHFIGWDAKMGYLN